VPQHPGVIRTRADNTGHVLIKRQHLVKCHAEQLYGVGEMCECSQDKESVLHILLHCSRFVEARSELEDATEDIYTYAKSNCYGLDKVTFIICQPCDNNILKIDNIFIKDALFQYIPQIGMKV